MNNRTLRYAPLCGQQREAVADQILLFDDAEQYDETLLSTDAGPDDDAVRVAAHPREHLQRIGADLPRATLANWMIQAGILIQPLINLLQDRLLSGDVVQMDETPVQVLKGAGNI